jgi:hypothetical protein
VVAIMPLASRRVVRFSRGRAKAAVSPVCKVCITIEERVRLDI